MKPQNCKYYGADSDGSYCEIHMGEFYNHCNVEYNDNCEYFKNKNTKTLREHLNELNNEDFVDWLINDWERLKYSFTQTRTGMIELLDKEYKE